MMSRQGLLRTIAGAGLALTATLAQAGPYSGIYVFGDSLSDSGNDLFITAGQVPAPAYYTDGTNVGRFGNGLNYVDRLAASLGLSLASSTVGGNDYAYGGARSNYVRPELVPYGALSFDAQVGQYLLRSGGTVDPNALYVLWIGSNDMADGFGQALAAGDPAPVAAAANRAIISLLTAFGRLEALGARHFVIGNVPNLGLLPSVRQLAGYLGGVYGGGDPVVEATVAAQVSGQATAAAQAFNNALAFYLPASTLPGVYVSQIDAFDMLTNLTSNPATYGVVNVTDGCYNGQPDGSATPGAGPVTVCANPDQYIYFDSEHPTSMVYQLLADNAYSQLVPEPGQWVLSLTALGLMSFMRRRPARI